LQSSIPPLTRAPPAGLEKLADTLSGRSEITGFQITPSYE